MSDTLQTLRESKSLPVGSRFQAICAMGEVSTKTAKTGTSYHEVTLADAQAVRGGGTDDTLEQWGALAQLGVFVADDVELLVGGPGIQQLEQTLLR